MLYDPKWGKPVETYPSLAGFIAWLEKQQPEQGYEFTDAENCAIAQWLRSIGEKKCALYSSEIVDLIGQEAGFILRGTKLDRNQTFGAALRRARAV